jgi:hypothetical protein
MEDILRLYRKEEGTFTEKEVNEIEDAIEEGYDTDSIFDDWVDYMADYDDNEAIDVMDFKEHYQNLLTHKENRTIYSEFEKL